MRTKKLPRFEVLASAILIIGGAFTTLIVSGIVPQILQRPGPVQDPGKWKLVFDDEFNESTLDLSKWSYNYPADWPHGGHTLNHDAYMDEANVFIENGLLRIKAENQRDPNAPPPENTSYGWLTYNYTAGAINTLGKFSAKYGYFEARMKLPGSTGFWPAFWTLNAAGGWPPEIDIHEWLSNEPSTLHCTFHWSENGTHKMSSQGIEGLPDLSKDFHIYGLEWTPDSLTWYFDNIPVRSYDNSATISQLQAQYIIINLAVGGWAKTPDASTIWPAYFDTDWVRVWQAA